MVVGQLKNEAQGFEIWESMQTNVIQPIQAHYDNANANNDLDDASVEVDVFYCVPNSSETRSLRDSIQAREWKSKHLKQQQRQLASKTIGGASTIFFFFDVEDEGNNNYEAQTNRIMGCDQRIHKYAATQSQLASEQKQQHSDDGADVIERQGEEGSYHYNCYDFIIRTRPDLRWFLPISTPFSMQHIMTRTRMVQSMNLTGAQLSWIKCEPWICRGAYSMADPNARPPFPPPIPGAPACGIVDDQLAVVPAIHHDAYFYRDGYGRAISSSSSVNIDTNDANSIQPEPQLDWPLMDISPFCPCAVHSFEVGEKILSRRLAQFNATVMVVPFHVVLAAYEGPGVREPKMMEQFNETIDCM